MKTLVIACVFLLLILVSGCSEGVTDITVKAPLKKLLMDYKEAHIIVEHARGQSARESGFGSTAIVSIRGDILSRVTNMGMGSTYDEGTSGLRVFCTVDHGWGLPRIIRHFQLTTTYITYINIKLIDVSTGEVIGEVEYRRPWYRLSDNPPDVISMMFAAVEGASLGSGAVFGHD